MRRCINSVTWNVGARIRMACGYWFRPAPDLKAAGAGLEPSRVGQQGWEALRSSSTGRVSRAFNFICELGDLLFEIYWAREDVALATRWMLFPPALCIPPLNHKSRCNWNLFRSTSYRLSKMLEVLWCKYWYEKSHKKGEDIIGTLINTAIWFQLTMKWLHSKLCRGYHFVAQICIIA